MNCICKFKHFCIIYIKLFRCNVIESKVIWSRKFNITAISIKNAFGICNWLFGFWELHLLLINLYFVCSVHNETLKCLEVTALFFICILFLNCNMCAVLSYNVRTRIRVPQCSLICTMYVYTARSTKPMAVSIYK